MGKGKYGTLNEDHQHGRSDLGHFWGIMAITGDAPDGQLDATQTAVIQDLVKDKPPLGEVVTRLDKMLQDCAYYSLASDFTMGHLRYLYDLAEAIHEATKDE